MLYNNKQENTILGITFWSMISHTHTHTHTHMYTRAHAHTHDSKQSTALFPSDFLLIIAGAPEKRNAPKIYHLCVV